MVDGQNLCTFVCVNQGGGTELGIASFSVVIKRFKLGPGNNGRGKNGLGKNGLGKNGRGRNGRRKIRLRKKRSEEKTV